MVQCKLLTLQFIPLEMMQKFSNTNINQKPQYQ